MPTDPYEREFDPELDAMYECREALNAVKDDREALDRVFKYRLDLYDYSLPEELTRIKRGQVPS